MLRLSRLGRGLIALRSPVAIDKVRAGQLLRVGETGSAAVLCSRGGTLVASVLPGGEAGVLAARGVGTVRGEDRRRDLRYFFLAGVR